MNGVTIRCGCSEHISFVGGVVEIVCGRCNALVHAPRPRSRSETWDPTDYIFCGAVLLLFVLTQAA